MRSSDVTEAVECLIGEILEEKDFSADIENQVTDAVESYFNERENREALVKEMIESMNDEEFESLILDIPSMKALHDFKKSMEKYVPILELLNTVIKVPPVE